MIFWKKYTKWYDLSAGAIDEDKFVIQGRKDEDGKLELRTVKAGRAWGCKTPTLEDLEKIIF